MALSDEEREAAIARIGAWYAEQAQAGRIVDGRRCAVARKLSPSGLAQRGEARRQRSPLARLVQRRRASGVTQSSTWRTPMRRLPSRRHGLVAAPSRSGRCWRSEPPRSSAGCDRTSRTFTAPRQTCHNRAVRRLLRAMRLGGRHGDTRSGLWRFRADHRADPVRCWTHAAYLGARPAAEYDLQRRRRRLVSLSRLP